MSEQDIRALAALDDIAEQVGGFVASPTDKDIHYDYRKILAYCKEKGIEPLDMTMREMNKFVIIQ